MQVIEALNRCHDENPFKKFFGVCNEAKVALNQCFVLEKERQRRRNFLKAKKFNDEFKKAKEEKKARQ